jgi:hypothetical protein
MFRKFFNIIPQLIPFLRRRGLELAFGRGQKGFHTFNDPGTRTALCLLLLQAKGIANWIAVFVVSLCDAAAAVNGGAPAAAASTGTALLVRPALVTNRPLASRMLLFTAVVVVGSGSLAIAGGAARVRTRPAPAVVSCDKDADGARCTSERCCCGCGSGGGLGR